MSYLPRQKPGENCLKRSLMKRKISAMKGSKYPIWGIKNTFNDTQQKSVCTVEIFIQNFGSACGVQLCLGTFLALIFAIVLQMPVWCEWIFWPRVFSLKVLLWVLRINPRVDICEVDKVVNRLWRLCVLLYTGTSFQQWLGYGENSRQNALSNL